MDRFEYLRDEREFSFSEEKEYLSNYGKRGWELVTVIFQDYDTFRARSRIYYWKRKKTNEGTN